MLTVLQCWDDGLTTDTRLVDILHRYEAKATFNLCAGLHEKHRKLGWIDKGVEIYRLGWDEMRDVYEGFTIANHSLTHPNLDQISIDDARRDIVEGRARLQQFFGGPVLGFAYPFGSYNEMVMQLVQDAGHVYARTTVSGEWSFPVVNPMSFHPTCHFLEPDFWDTYEKAKKRGGFYFWGHSYEMINETMWRAFENMIERISADPYSSWVDIADLFNKQS
jgi:peptidoglycan/xylan/chitin deacetylase (PgdA/CDA1 family)